MIPKAIADITKADIEGLVSAKTPERRTLDYKEELPGNTDEQKREFLYDVSSFANAASGDFLFGVSDQRDSNGKPTGVPDKVIGLSSSNIAADVARLENMIQSAIEPRIPGVQFRDITGFPNGPILVVRVPKSWASPHMVTFKGASRFYSRNSVGKYPLDVQELRAAFLASESIGLRIRQFRDERLARITAGEVPIPLAPGSRVVLHLIPLTFSRTETIDLSQAEQQLTVLLKPIAANAWGKRFNLDGFLTFSERLGNYVQLFRSGAIEVLDNQLVMLPGRIQEINEAFISTNALERETIDAFERSVDVLKRLGVASTHRIHKPNRRKRRAHYHQPSIYLPQ